MPMCHLRKTFNISDRSAGVRHGFGVDCLRIITNRRFDGGQIVDITDEIAMNAEFRQEISKRVDGRTIQIHRSDDTTTTLSHAHQCIGDRSHA